MDVIRFPIEQLVNEQAVCNDRDRFSHPVLTRKIPKEITPCDYSKTEKLIEIEFTDGDRRWVHIGEFFGKVIAEAKTILILYPNGNTEEMSVVGIESIKIKRTRYWKLILERDLPF